MKILIVDDSYTFGGAQIAAANMARYITEQFDFDVTFICSKKNEALVARLRTIKIGKVRTDGYAALPVFILSHLICLWRLFSIIAMLRAEKPDTVIVNMAGMEFGWLYIYATKLLKIRLICWLHNPFRYDEMLPSVGLKKMVMKGRDFSAKIFSRIIYENLYTVSNSARSYLLNRFGRNAGIRIFGNTIFSKNNSIDLSIENVTQLAIDGYPADKIILIPGRISYGDKGQDQVVKSLAYLEKKACAVVFVGDGGDFVDLKRRCTGFSNVFFVGWQQSVDEYIAGADVVLLPSRYEAQPLIALEVMTLGIPVLTSKIPSFTELVGNEFTCELDDGPALYTSIENVTVMAKPDLLEKYKVRLDLFTGESYKKSVLANLTSVA